MKLKLLDLNIYGGKCYDNIISFVKANDFDILCLQEVKGGNLSFTNINTLQKLKQDLGMEAEFVFSTNLAGDKNSYDGNAIFYKNDLRVLNRQNAQLYPFSEIRPDETDFSFYPRTAISLNFNINGNTLTVINTQLAWNKVPKKTPIQTAVGQNLLKFVEKCKNDFILTGDFNLESDSGVVSQFGKIARNLTQENGLTNTLNPRTHRVKEIFPRGLAVDFIFTTSGIKVIVFDLVDSPDLSDHFGLSLTFSI